METTPIGLFNEWFAAEKALSTARIPEACCLSTIGADGFPNARFLALKEVRQGRFVITGPDRSRKGQEMRNDPKVALTFWWPHSERQVRVQGVASRISKSDADRYFSERGLDAQLISNSAKQGQRIADFDRYEREMLADMSKFKEFLSSQSEDLRVHRPSDWGGFEIDPIRIEFLEFAPSRLHRRTLYEREGETWNRSYLEP